MHITKGLQNTSLLLLLVLITFVTGCDPHGDLPIYEPGLSPDSLLRIMNQRALIAGGGDCDVQVNFVSKEARVKFVGALAFDSPSKYRLQLSSKGEPPVADIIANGGLGGFYFPNVLKTLEAPIDQLLQSPNGMLLLAEAMRHMTGDLQGFTPYGVQAETKDFVFMRTAGKVDCRAFIHRPTLTISELVYSMDDEVIFTIQYGKYIPLGDGIWPRAFLISAPDFFVEVTTKAMALSGRHSLLFFQFDELPGTQTVNRIEDLGEILWQD